MKYSGKCSHVRAHEHPYNTSLTSGFKLLLHGMLRRLTHICVHSLEPGSQTPNRALTGTNPHTYSTHIASNQR